MSNISDLSLILRGAINKLHFSFIDMTVIALRKSVLKRKVLGCIKGKAQTNRDRTTFFLLSLSLLADYLLVRYGGNYQHLLSDEGTGLYYADRILSGDIPYKDFFLEYLPGTFYLLAFMFKLFGSSVLVGRMIMVVLGTLITIFIYTLAKKIASKKFAFVSALFFLFIGIPFGNAVTAAWVALFFGFCSVFLMSKFLENHGYRWLMASGTATGLSILNKQNVGVYLAAAIVGFIFIFSIFSNKRGKYYGFFKTLGLYLSGISLILFLFIVYIALNGGIRGLFVAIFLYPFDYLQWGAILFPSLGLIRFSLRQDISILIFYLPLFILLISGVFLVLDLRKSLAMDFTSQCRILFLLFAIFMFCQMYPRADFSHLVRAMPPAFILLGYILEKTYLGVRRFFDGSRQEERITLCGLTLLLTLPVAFGAYVFTNLFLPGVKANTYTLELARAEGVTFPKESVDLKKIVDFMKANTDKQSSVFVFSSDGFGRGRIINFLSERKDPSKYAFLFGFPKTHKEIVESLEISGTRFIIAYVLPDKRLDQELFRRGEYFYRYLFANFTIAQSYGPFVIYEKMLSHSQ